MQNTNWNIDVSHSGINFSVKHMVFANVRGRFASWSGTIHMDETDLNKSSVEVEIDASSIDTGVADRDNHLRSADFLDVEQFPKLIFKSTKLEKVKDDRYQLHGKLTLHGVSKEVVLDMSYGGQAKDPWGNQRAAFTASTSLDRREFGLKWNQALEAGGLLVGERIDIELEVQAVQLS
ncbi:MAG: YceI family protein [Myxococcales bacterium]|nr:MAG: YceI family protein [Myxococcales bacterium]